MNRVEATQVKDTARARQHDAAIEAVKILAIQKVRDGFIFPEPLDTHVRAYLAACSLEREARDALAVLTT